MYEYFISKGFIKKKKKEFVSYTWGNLNFTTAKKVVNFEIQMNNIF